MLAPRRTARSPGFVIGSLGEGSRRRNEPRKPPGTGHPGRTSRCSGRPVVPGHVSTTTTSEDALYIFVTVLLAVMIAGFGAGVALGLRLPPAD